MYFCERCRAKNDWPKSLATSKGPCAVCGSYRVCYDVRSKELQEGADYSEEPIVRFLIKMVGSQVEAVELMEKAMKEQGIEYVSEKRPEDGMIEYLLKLKKGGK